MLSCILSMLPVTFWMILEQDCGPFEGLVPMDSLSTFWDTVLDKCPDPECGWGPADTKGIVAKPANVSLQGAPGLILPCVKATNAKDGQGQGFNVVDKTRCGKLLCETSGYEWQEPGVVDKLVDCPSRWVLTLVKFLLQQTNLLILMFFLNISRYLANKQVARLTVHLDDVISQNREEIKFLTGKLRGAGVSADDIEDLFTDARPDAETIHTDAAAHHEVTGTKIKGKDKDKLTQKKHKDKKKKGKGKNAKDNPSEMV